MIVLVTLVSSSSSLDLCQQNQPSLPFVAYAPWRVWRANARHALVAGAGPAGSRLGMAGHLLRGLGPHGALLRSAQALLRPREDGEVLGGADRQKRVVKHGNPWKSPIK